MALITIGLALTSCGNKTNNKTNNKTITEQSINQSKEYTSAYVCPMHCEGSGSDKAGICPVCGMDYVENEKHQTDRHSHE